MSVEEYRNAVIRAAQISVELSAMLDERGQDLFEEYGNTYEEIVRHETANKDIKI